MENILLKLFGKALKSTPLQFEQSAPKLTHERAEILAMRRIEEGIPHLRRFDLSGLNLERATLSNFDLRETKLTKTNLEYAILDSADLRGADLTSANLQEITLCNAKLDHADFRTADLSLADLTNAKLNNAKNLGSANLQGAKLVNADLSGVDLYNAKLYRADLRNAALMKANLCNANLYGADLRGANLQGADLRGANLTDADLGGADLLGAHLDADWSMYAKSADRVKNMPLQSEPIDTCHGMFFMIGEPEDGPGMWVSAEELRYMGEPEDYLSPEEFQKWIQGECPSIEDELEL